MQSVSEMPHDAIAHVHSKIFKYRMELYIERDYLTVVHIVTYLPAYISQRMENAGALCDYTTLLLQVYIQTLALFIFFSQIVGR